MGLFGWHKYILLMIVKSNDNTRHWQCQRMERNQTTWPHLSFIASQLKLPISSIIVACTPEQYAGNEGQPWCYVCFLLCWFFLQASSTRESIMPMLQLTQDEKPIVWRPFKCPRGQALEGLGKRPGPTGEASQKTPRSKNGPEFPLSASNSFEIAGQKPRNLQSIWACLKIGYSKLTAPCSQSKLPFRGGLSNFQRHPYSRTV